MSKPKSNARGATEDEVHRHVDRTLGTLGLFLIAFVLLAGWLYTGYYKLEPGEAGVILRLGRYDRTELEPGWKLRLPPPIETLETVKVSSIQQEEFGGSGKNNAEETVPEGEAHAGPSVFTTNMQTKDNNIVNVSFVVQYRIKSAFDSLYKVAEPGAVLRDAAQAAMREVVGRTSIDGVLSDERALVQAESSSVLQKILDDYESGLEVLAVQLQEVQPPAAVRAAFDDVIAATQDANRIVNEAQGYANEVIPSARGKVAVLRESAEGYRQAKVAAARGESEAFLKLLSEYEKAPDVTRERLYLETLEDVLPNARTILVDPSAGNLLQVLSLDDLGVKLGRDTAK